MVPDPLGVLDLVVGECAGERHQQITATGSELMTGMTRVSAIDGSTPQRRHQLRRFDIRRAAPHTTNPDHRIRRTVIGQDRSGQPLDQRGNMHPIRGGL